MTDELLCIGTPLIWGTPLDLVHLREVEAWLTQEVVDYLNMHRAPPPPGHPRFFIGDVLRAESYVLGAPAPRTAARIHGNPEGLIRHWGERAGFPFDGSEASVWVFADWLLHNGHAAHSDAVRWLHTSARSVDLRTHATQDGRKFGCRYPAVWPWWCSLADVERVAAILRTAGHGSPGFFAGRPLASPRLSQPPAHPGPRSPRRGTRVPCHCANGGS